MLKTSRYIRSFLTFILICSLFCHPVPALAAGNGIADVSFTDGIIDVISQKILPIAGRVSTVNESELEQLDRSKKGI